MKPFLIITAMLLVVTLAAGLLYVGYDYGLRNSQKGSNITARPTPIPLSFKPPIPLNNPSIMSAHMQYVINGVIGEITTKKKSTYIAFFDEKSRLIGNFKLDQGVMIYTTHGTKNKLLLTDLKKGQLAQIDLSYNSFSGGGEDIYITYILLK